MNENTNIVNEEVIEVAEEFVPVTSGGSLKALGVVGGVVAIGAAIYFGVKAYKAKKEKQEDNVTEVDFKDVDESEVEAE